MRIVQFGAAARQTVMSRQVVGRAAVQPQQPQNPNACVGVICPPGYGCDARGACVPIPQKQGVPVVSNSAAGPAGSVARAEQLARAKQAQANAEAQAAAEAAQRAEEAAAKAAEPQENRAVQAAANAAAAEALRDAQRKQREAEQRQREAEAAASTAMKAAQQQSTPEPTPSAEDNTPVAHSQPTDATYEPDAPPAGGGILFPLAIGFALLKAFAFI